MATYGSMRAYTHNMRGHPSDTLNLSSRPIPTLQNTKTPHSSQILVKISHCALNPGASIIMQLLPFFFRTSPSIPEMDFSGTIQEISSGGASEAEGETPLTGGTKVFGSVPVGRHVRNGVGALSEYVVVDAADVVPITVSDDDEVADEKMAQYAGLGIAGATALELMKAAGLKRGDSVLVNGASGGIGHLVVQMCKEVVGETGEVVAVCSGHHEVWVGELGVDEIIDYQVHAPVHAYLAARFGDSKFNAIIDAAGIQDLFEHCPEYLISSGPYVTVGPRPQTYSYLDMLSTISIMIKNILWPRILGGVPRDYRQVTGIANANAMVKLRTMVEEGRLKMHVVSCLGEEDAIKAYKQLLDGHAGGKVVVRMEYDTGIDL